MTVRELIRDLVDCADMEDDVVYLQTWNAFFQDVKIDWGKHKQGYLVLVPKENPNEDVTGPTPV